MKTENQMREILRKACKEAGSQKDFAIANKVSAQFICRILKGKRGVTQAIGRVLGYKKTEVWVKK